MYRVIRYFTDLCDHGHEYRPGDPFPRPGASADDQRIAELSGCGNRQGEPLIEKIPDPSRPPNKKKSKKGA